MPFEKRQALSRSSFQGLIAQQAREDAERRLGISDNVGGDDNDGANSFAMLGFESPPRKLRF